MKYKKYSYIIVIMLMLILNISEIHASTCYYVTSDKQTLIEYESSSGSFKIVKRTGEYTSWFNDGEKLINNGKSFDDKNQTGIVVDAVEKGKCPNYIVYRRNPKFLHTSEGIFGFSTNASAENFYNKSKEIDNMSAHKLTYKNESGEAYTKKDFNNYIIDIDTGQNADVNCHAIFGDKNNPESIRYLVDEILSYPRIIVPILVIVLGMLDLAKAVIAGKEDQMRKAQATFVKRIIAGVVIFLIPVLVDLIMGLADIVWAGKNYTTGCGL